MSSITGRANLLLTTSTGGGVQMGINTARPFQDDVAQGKRRAERFRPVMATQLT
ncbi:hypothetical protein [Tenebrionicola larvae]|uniref:Uncharacterized protein n=1 Tax=Tenebrionicola larvae TaxID=2815733 RepID=A0A949Q6L8_9ENTR|nr:hypothetical protein [Tenebrionicola larvae]MBV5095834.1 hypothetical protein [Tenebrionicola larvae]